MHSFLLVAGDNIHDQLAPFSDHLEVDPYETFLSDEDIKSMADHYGVPVTDLGTLATKMQDWRNDEGFVRDGRLGYISTYNPRGRHDWYQIGGAWANALKLRQPRKRRLFGIIPVGTTLRATTATKCEIDQQALLANPPTSLLFNGEWFASPIYPYSDEADAKWRAEFAEHFARIPDDILLTVVDLHS
ncbi:MAG TPA: hypothetical protein VF773_21270 [Verrucomicrobiae bacterium]